MTKGYFRSRQGKGFQKTDAGDLGIRAFKDQQDQQMQAMERVKETDLFYRRQHQGSLEDIGRNQIDNMRIVQNVEDKKYQTRKSAVEKRKSTEVQRLKDEARIAGDKAKWLQEFAPKAAQNFFQASTGLYDLYERYTADQKFKELIASGKFDAGINFLNTLDEKTRADVIAGRNKAFADKDIQAVDYLKSILQNSNGYLSEKLANQIIERSDGIEASLKRYVTKDDGSEANKWDAESVYEYYQMRGRELVKQFGLTGKGAQKILNHFETRGALESSKLADFDRLRDDKKDRLTAVDDTVSFLLSSEKDSKNVIQQGTITYATKSYRQAKGGEIFTNDNVRDAHVMHFQDVVATGKVTDFEGLKKRFLDSCTPETSGDTCVTWRTRHPHLEKDLNDVLIKAKKALAQKADDKREGDDGAMLADLTQRLNGTGPYAPGGEKENESLVSIDTVEKFETALQQFKIARKQNLTKSGNQLASLLHLNPRAISIPHKIESLWREILSGDTLGAAAIWRTLSSEQRSNPELQNLYKQSRIILMGGIQPTGRHSLDGWAKSTISQEVGITIGGLTNQVHTSGINMEPVLVQTFHFHFNDLLSSGKYGTFEELASDTGKAKALVKAAKTLALEDLRSDEGLFKTRDADEAPIGSSQKHKIFLHGEGDRNRKTLSNNDILEAAKKANGDLKSPYILNAIGPQTLSNLAEQIISSDSVDLPEAVHVAYELSTKNMTKTQFVNSLLAYHKFGPNVKEGDKEYGTLRINENVHDIAQMKVERLFSKDDGITTIKVGERDAIAISVYSDIINQTGQIPMSAFTRGESLAEKLNLEYGTDLSEIEVDYNGFVNIPFGATYEQLIKDRHKLGIKIVATEDGGFVIQQRVPPEPVLNRESGTPPNLQYYGGS